MDRELKVARLVAAGIDGVAVELLEQRRRFLLIDFVSEQMQIKQGTQGPTISCLEDKSGLMYKQN